MELKTGTFIYMIKKYLKIIVDGFTGYWNYLQNELLYPSWHNYFYWLVGLSLVVWLLEIIFPWRTEQSVVRKDFWLDGFYMFFNFFLFSLIYSLIFYTELLIPGFGLVEKFL